MKASVWVRHCHPPEDYLLKIMSSFGIRKVDMQFDSSIEDQLRAKYDFKYSASNSIQKNEGREPCRFLWLSKWSDD